jgi:hypothetical protein
MAWNDSVRTDGALVEKAPVLTASGEESWIIVVPGRLPILLCPCCDRPMKSALAATLVADKLYPQGSLT